MNTDLASVTLRAVKKNFLDVVVDDHIAPCEAGLCFIAFSPSVKRQCVKIHVVLISNRKPAHHHLLHTAPRCHIVFPVDENTSDMDSLLL